MMNCDYALRPGDCVLYRGHPAEVRHVFAATANIVMLRPVRGLSRQLDAYLSELMPAPLPPAVERACYLTELATAR